MVPANSCTESSEWLYDINTFNHVIEFADGFITTDYAENDGEDPRMIAIDLELTQKLIAHAEAN